MTTATYQQLALDWHPKKQTDKPFIIFASAFLVLFMALGVFMGSVEIPKETERKKVAIPERIAKFIAEKPKEKVKPKPVVKTPPKPKPMPKVEEKPKEEKKPKIKKQQPKKKIILTEKQVKARDKASKSGLLALSSELADLTDTSSIDKMMGKKIVKTNTAKLASNNNDILSANAAKGSDGVSSTNVLTSASSKKTVKLDQAEVAAAQQQLLASRSDITIVEGKPETKASEEPYQRTGNYRPDEDIALVMEQNKSKLYALFRKAKRSNPGIKGTIVLEITIAPDGKVLKVDISSSELNDKRLESRIVSRVKQLDFGSANVKPVTVTYPINFLAS